MLLVLNNATQDITRMACKQKALLCQPTDTQVSLECFTAFKPLKLMFQRCLVFATSGNGHL